MYYKLAGGFIYVETGTRPLLPLSLWSNSGGNVQVTCRSPLEGTERQLSHLANVNSRPNAALQEMVSLMREYGQYRPCELEMLGGANIGRYASKYMRDEEKMGAATKISLVR